MNFEEIETLSASNIPGFEKKRNGYDLDAKANVGQVVSEHFDGEELDVFVWPWTGGVEPPHPGIESIEELNNVGAVYAAGGNCGTQANKFHRVDDHISLDILQNEELPDCLRGEILSHDVAELARNNKLEAIGVEGGFEVEYAKDIGMELFYHSSKDELSESEIDELFERVAEDSRQMISEGGLFIADLHDYSTSRSMVRNPYLHDPEEPWESKKKHMWHITSIYEDKFEEATPALMFHPKSYFREETVEEHYKAFQELGMFTNIEDVETFKKYDAKPFVIARNPLDK